MRPERLHHLDALRALTMVLILPAHALAMMGLRSGWNDVEASIFWAIHVFRLPLFFLIAGFFGALLVNARGTGALVRNRLVRIGVPFAVVVVLVAPVLTLMLQGLSVTSHRPHASGAGAFLDFHPSYVWFLWYLAMLYAGALLLRRAALPLPQSLRVLRRAGERLLPHWIAPLLLAIPVALLLYRQPTWIAEAPAESFSPRLDLLAYYAVFFACGWGLFSIAGLRDTIESRPRQYVVLASLSAPAGLALYLLQSEPAIGTSRAFHLLALLLLSVATWSLAFGLLGIARHFLREPSPRLRYWADASYWIYLSHLPVMAALAIVLFEVSMPNSVRLMILIVATLAIICPAYGAFVRHTAIGRVLHGPRSLDARAERRGGWRGVTRPAGAAEPRA